MKPVDLMSYQDALAFFNTCRSETAGKPLPGRWRMFKRGDNHLQIGIPIWSSGGYVYEELCTISPGNVVTFTMPHPRMLCLSNSLVMVLSKVLPLTIRRKHKGVYNIGYNTLREYRHKWGSPYCYEPSTGRYTEYFTGVKFDLTARVCLNPRPDMLDQVLPDRRQEWLRAVKQFKRGLKTRAKVGALRGHIEAVSGTLGLKGISVWQLKQQVPDWVSPEFTHRVLECMRSNEYPPEILHRLVVEAWLRKSGSYHRSPVTDQDVLKAVDSVFDTYSIHFRKAFGVFGDEHTAA